MANLQDSKRPRLNHTGANGSLRRKELHYRDRGRRRDLGQGGPVPFDIGKNGRKERTRVKDEDEGLTGTETLERRESSLQISNMGKMHTGILTNQQRSIPAKA
ncbi:hypothetical protein Nepgr_024033 [Nepenthes gracilis]|uniref:Uncharacterized protein n=1 Tax=Nepenthes gracilis TaxID=150966 RepID=A0AAD3T2F6_NEPGR|nr:hypothetical protein Nepgr_024033 [Nepenthes gracilis]